MNSIRVLLVDDHVIFRRGLKTVLTEFEDIIVLGEAEDGLQAIQESRKLKPDLILMDINMPGMDGLEALERIRRENPSIPIVMLTVSEETNDLFSAIKKGAKGYVLKNITPDELHQKLIALQKGEAPISGIIATKIIQEFQQNEPTGDKPTESQTNQLYEGLSQRENEVLIMVAQGLTNQEIANRLYITESTVKTHLRVILEKLQLKNRVQAAVYAAEHRLTEK